MNVFSVCQNGPRRSGASAAILGSEESGASAGSNPDAGDAPRGALCRVADIPDGNAIGVHVPSSTGGFDLILLRLGERVFAYHN